MHNDSSVTCTEDDTKLTCTAYTAGDSFSYITSVVNRDETADERDARLLEEARLAKEAWHNQLTVVTNSLTTANTAQANATTIVNGNDSLPSKLISINQSKQANGLFLSSAVSSLLTTEVMYENESPAVYAVQVSFVSSSVQVTLESLCISL
jgi:hypothetical protein